MSRLVLAEQLSVGDVVLLQINTGNRRARLEVAQQRASSVKLIGRNLDGGYVVRCEFGMKHGELATVLEDDEQPPHFTA
ncbi:hypothetical protein AB0K00_25110 [Dactylosporangium sp. NPDC049525]|uniref:hypothetical protein n=1 Tax=Dactylosporangium sp. NPDC049525 TaxID=3154730 RepID=UPI003413E093